MGFLVAILAVGKGIFGLRGSLGLAIYNRNGLSGVLGR